VHADDNNDPIDEIKDYWKARYLSTGEAMWQILSFNVTKMDPAVSAISIHLPSSHSNYQYLQLTGHSSTLSSLHHYFLHPAGSFIHEGIEWHFNSLSYVEYYCLFQLAKYNMHDSH